MGTRTLLKIEEYFNQLKKVKPKIFEIRVTSFENILDAIEEGDVIKLKELIVSTISVFRQGRYVHFLNVLLNDLEKSGIESLKKDAQSVDRNLFQPTEKGIEMNQRPQEKGLRESEKTTFQVKERIKDLISDLKQYEDKSEANLQKARSSMQTPGYHTEDPVEFGIGFLQSKVTTGFYTSGLKIDMDLTRNKINLSGFLRGYLYEAISDLNPQNENNVLTMVLYYLILASMENQNLTNEAMLGSTGTLGKLINRVIDEFKKDYPQCFIQANELVAKYLQQEAEKKSKKPEKV